MADDGHGRGGGTHQQQTGGQKMSAGRLRSLGEAALSEHRYEEAARYYQQADLEPDMRRCRQPIQAVPGAESATEAGRGPPGPDLGAGARRRHLPPRRCRSGWRRCEWYECGAPECGRQRGCIEDRGQHRPWTRSSSTPFGMIGRTVRRGYPHKMMAKTAMAVVRRRTTTPHRAIPRRPRSTRR